MRVPKKERQQELLQTIEQNPFITDEALATRFRVSIQMIRLDRMELKIPELRERIKHVATERLDDVRTLTENEVIGDMIDLKLDTSAISILEILPEHAFSRNAIARGHILFAQANSLAIALIDDELALTTRANVQFTRSVHVGERVVAKAFVSSHRQDGRSDITVESYVGEECVFIGEFTVYRSSKEESK
ncbi:MULTISPECIES: transcription factor FapR [Exiguobacterium]|uniref:transcription factor FapR n=1 Tax=Exiguobacterium TaxID=33986 RepID=UPI000494990E|nr:MULTISPECIES: transcription factor FapR [Exiguobacterium]HCD59689.1 transcription factor FapR [Exiguobacterium sp.]